MSTGRLSRRALRVVYDLKHQCTTLRSKTRNAINTAIRQKLSTETQLLETDLSIATKIQVNLTPAFHDSSKDGQSETAPRNSPATSEYFNDRTLSSKGSYEGTNSAILSANEDVLSLYARYADIFIENLLILHSRIRHAAGIRGLHNVITCANPNWAHVSSELNREDNDIANGIHESHPIYRHTPFNSMVRKTADLLSLFAGYDANHDSEEGIKFAIHAYVCCSELLEKQQAWKNTELDRADFDMLARRIWYGRKELEYMCTIRQSVTNAEIAQLRRGMDRLERRWIQGLKELDGYVSYQLTEEALERVREVQALGEQVEARLAGARNYGFLSRFFQQVC